jgi:hypothetical protein
LVKRFLIGSPVSVGMRVFENSLEVIQILRSSFATRGRAIVNASTFAIAAAKRLRGQVCVRGGGLDSVLIMGR